MSFRLSALSQVLNMTNLMHTWANITHGTGMMIIDYVSSAYLQILDQASCMGDYGNRALVKLDQLTILTIASGSTYEFLMKLHI